MANTRDMMIHGVVGFGQATVVGNVVTKIPFGQTEGMKWTNKIDEFMVESDQSLMPLANIMAGYTPSLTGTLLEANLKVISLVLGLPTSAHTGDLEATTPTDEILLITATQIASAPPATYYLDQNGKLGLRTFLFENAILRPEGDMSFSKKETVKVGFRLQILAPADPSQPAIKVTDAAA